MTKFETISLILSSIFISSPVFAEYTLYGLNEDKNAEVYYDFDDVRKNGDWHYYWELNNLFEPVFHRNKYVYSVELHRKINCATRDAGLISVIYYSKQMGQGSSWTEKLDLSSNLKFWPDYVKRICNK